MTHVVFETPGSLDLRSLTMMGMNAKPNTESPIGYFGTGLKYAMGVLARMNIPVELWINGKHYEIRKEETSFRGKDFEQILLIKKRKMVPDVVVRLPFTTEYGKNWQLWQVFRELHSNTLDERGSTWQLGDQEIWQPNFKDHTYIVVHGDEFLSVFKEMDTIFHPKFTNDWKQAEASVQVLLEPSKYIYYRSMRVMELQDPSLLTYNILSNLELTEDRTVKYGFEAERIIREHIISQEDKDLIERVVNAKKGTFEHRLNFESYHHRAPSQGFIKTARSLGTSPNSTFNNMLDTYDEEKKPKLEPPFLPLILKAFEDADTTLLSKLLNEHNEQCVAALQMPGHEVPASLLCLRQYGGIHHDDVEMGWFDSGQEKGIIADLFKHVRELQEFILTMAKLEAVEVSATEVKAVKIVQEDDIPY